ncbi:MAG: hypothetical protein Ct9H300mP14_11890 [Gammaproteobacteria bacterium]|nr:MAG: hypothetical protein Ct9H300mP14_11890 [Gammaproteobacteria bacterium]
MMSAYFLGFAIGTFLRDSDQPGRPHPGLSALAAIARSAHCWCYSFQTPGLGSLTGWHGYSHRGLFVVVESWLNNRSTNQGRGAVMAVYITIGYAASSLGQQTLHWATPAGRNFFCWSACC